MDEFYTVIGLTSEDGEDLTVAAVVRGRGVVADQHDRGWMFEVEAESPGEAQALALADFNGS
ncbi:hypothetical protein ACQPW3_36395 [Actinosynnema sp. CA-248983]